MSAEQQDALRFLELLYRGKPEPSVIVVTPKASNGSWARSHFVRSPQDALPYVLGAVDVYTRITPIAQRPQKGRGNADDSIALPSVWAEFDVNGTPNGRGGVVSGAFPDLDAATEIATGILEPTMLVNSGGGLHGYYLLERMLPLGSTEDRARARALVQGFQARLRTEAHERFGVRKLDSTHDLARVFRPPGSMNGKGETPRPVQLLDDGGPRYTVEQIDAETICVEDPPPTDAGEASTECVREILDRHEDLAKLVARKGPKPGDGSPSTWDFQLGCRAAEHGYDDDALASLIRHARRVHGEDKGEREDYVERTIAAVRKRVGYVSGDATRDAVLAELTKALRLAKSTGI